MRRRAKILLAATALAALLASVSAAPANASPAWRFDGEQLEGKETLIGGATGVQLTFFGLTTTCDGFLYIMKVENIASVGKGEITYLPIFDCTTNGACSVERAEAEELPWPTPLASVSGKNYVTFKNVHVLIEYGGEECVLGEIEFDIVGTMGALYNNETETMTFSPSSFEKTKTKLQTFSTEVELSAVLSAEAFGPHLGEAVTVG